MKNGSSTIRILSPELQKVARDELHEIPEKIDDLLREIRQWLQENKHINARNDDQWLITFLRGCKYNLEKTKQKLDDFYLARTAVTEFFTDRNPFNPEIQRILNLGLYIPMPKTATAASPTIILARNCVLDPNIDKFEDIFKTWTMLLDILMIENDNFVVAGNILVADMTGVTLAHYAIPPGTLERVLKLYQKIYPLRLKGMHLINTNSFVDIIYSIIKPFLSEKTKSRFKQCTPEFINEYYKEMPQRVFPKEHGGEAGLVGTLIEDWKTKVESYADWFEEDEKFRSIETLRPGKPKTASDMFSVDSSFRRLNCD